MNDALRAAATTPAAAPDHETGSSTHAWWLGATGRTLERERLEHRASHTDADRAASPLLSSLDPAARAPEPRRR